MRRLIITKGIPGSGKSTWAREQVRTSNGRVKRVNKDDLRRMIDAGNFSVDNEKLVNSIQERIITTALGKGHDVICDNTNFGHKTFVSLCEIAELIGDVEVTEKYFEVTIKEAIHRNASRVEEDRVPEHIIRTMYDKHVNGKKVEVRKAYYPPRELLYRNEACLPEAIIVDLDGTLAINDGHRNYFDYSLVCNDKVSESIAALVRSMYNDGVVVLAVSGREDYCIPDTKLWLETHDIPYHEVFMRPTKDYRKDYIIKREIFENKIKGQYHVLFAIDDRDQVVNQWRRLGIPTLQCDYGDF